MMTLKTLMLATAALLAPLGAVAQDAAATGVAQQLQWGGVDVTAEQFQPMVDFAANVLGLTPLVQQDNFAVFMNPNGSLFEVYGPGAPDAPWRDQGVAYGFAVDDIEAVTAKAEAAGVTPLGDAFRVPGAGTDGGDYVGRFFQGPDGRVYSISQTSGNGTSDAPVE